MVCKCSVTDTYRCVFLDSEWSETIGFIMMCSLLFYNIGLSNCVKKNKNNVFHTVKNVDKLNGVPREIVN